MSSVPIKPFKADNAQENYKKNAYKLPRNKRAAAAGELPDKITVRLIGLNGTTTAIGTLDTKTGELRFGDSWFSLDGTKLDGKPTKSGVYINNGKKIVVK